MGKYIQFLKNGKSVYSIIQQEATSERATSCNILLIY